MKIVYFTFFLLLYFNSSFSQNRESKFNNYVKYLEKEIIFNEYLTSAQEIQKINELVVKVKDDQFKNKPLFLKYAEVSLIFSEDKDDEVLYKYVELKESCDTTNQFELVIYLSSLLKISEILSKDNAIELSFKYLESGIKIIERKKLIDYAWVQNFYNDSGVDLLSMGRYEECQIAFNNALLHGKNKDHIQDAMIEYNLSFLNYELNNIDSAIFHQKHTIQHLEKIKNLSDYPHLYSRYANAFGSLAIFHFSKGEFEQAGLIAHKSDVIYENIEFYDSHRYPHLFTLINLAIKNNEVEKIEYFLSEIKLVATKVEAGRHNFYLLLSKSYELIDDVENGNHYLELAYSQFQTESNSTVSKLQKYNSKLQANILTREKEKFQIEKETLSRKALFNTTLISLVLISLITILYVLYIRTRNKKDLLEKEKEISKIEIEKNDIKSKLTESELNEKRLVANQLASHIKLKQQTESAFLQKIKELKRNKSQNIEAEVTELQLKMMNLINIDQNFEYHIQVNDLNQEFVSKLKTNHPELSDKEVQFCSYLLLNLSTKEIGSITNQSDGAVRVYKNRLKNKLISKLDVDLIDYLQNI